MPPPATGDAQTYCVALLNQEKSLEELQKHLHKTEVLPASVGRVRPLPPP